MASGTSVMDTKDQVGIFWTKGTSVMDKDQVRIFWTTNWLVDVALVSGPSGPDR